MIPFKPERKSMVLGEKDMKDLSFFLLKNALGAKMRKGFKQFCNGDGSTSTLNQQAMMMGQEYSPRWDGVGNRQPTLEEMILQLELEEAASRRAKIDEEYGEIRHRMSCVNSSDILRSARSALNQYPRFSLDGKDAMYRSSFRNMPGSSPGPGCSRRGFHEKVSDSEARRLRGLPATVAGESVVWCRPGLVAKLMGLEAVPIPVRRYRWRRDHHPGMLNNNAGFITKQQNLRKTSGRLHDHHQLDRNGGGDGDRGMERGVVNGGGTCSSSAQGYRFMKPLGADVELRDEQFRREMRRFRHNIDASRY